MVERDTLSLYRLLADRPIPLRLLLEAYGDASNVIAYATAEELRMHGIDPSAVRRCRQFYEAAVSRDLQWLEKQGNHLLTIEQAAYPSLLREIYDPPPVLFASGDPMVLARPAVAIVGSRRASRLGIDTARSLATDLCASGLVIVSGLARGIDGAGHRGALAGNGATIAVLGSGCDVIYPSKHITLAQEITSCGLLLSEFPLRRRPAPWHFPRRNRIVSGLTIGTIVVEAALPSGSLISARAALEQGREVFAIPGPVNRSQSRGCHQLLREGATLVETADDVVNQLSFLTGSLPATRTMQGTTDDGASSASIPAAGSGTNGAGRSAPRSAAKGSAGSTERTSPETAALNAEQQSVLTTLQSDAISADRVAALTILPIEVVVSALIELEILGLIYQEAGGYCRT